MEHSHSFSVNIVEESQFLQGSLVFQWTFAVMGISLPPLLNGCLDGRQKTKRHKKYVWLGVIIHSLVLFALVMWMVYVNNVVVDVVVDNNDLDSITSVLSIAVNIAVAMVQLVMQLIAFVKHSSIKMMLLSIAQLERDISLYYVEYQWLQHELELDVNFPERCRRFRCKILWRFGLYMLVFSCLLCFLNYYLISEIMSLRDRLFTLFCLLLLQMKSVEFCIVIQIVGELIDSLQNFLKCLQYEIAKSKGKCFFNGGALLHRKLTANQFLINRTWLLVTCIEEHFAIPLLALYLYNGIAITHTINWSYVSSFYRTDLLENFRLTFIMLIFLHMLVPCWLTQCCIEKYNNFGSILHNIKMNEHDSVLNLRIREYSLQLRHQKMLFTCAGFFDVNLRYFGLMILSMSTYVAILIQFKLQKETERASFRL